MDFAPDGSGTLTSAAASTALKSFFRYSQEISWARRGTDTNLWKRDWKKTCSPEGRSSMQGSQLPDRLVMHSTLTEFSGVTITISTGLSGVNEVITQLITEARLLKLYQGSFGNFRIQPFYYPTDVALSDTLVLLNLPAGKAIGKFKVVDEATDNSYEVSLVCDSTLNGTEWCLTTTWTGIRCGPPVSLKELTDLQYSHFIVDDAHGNSIRATRLLLLTASLSAVDEVDDELFTLYPVPFSDQLVITLPPSGIKVTVRNLTGRIVSEMLTSGSRVTYPAAGLTPGIYIVTVTTNRGDQFSRIVVKK
jgi:hypothetical protein